MLASKTQGPVYDIVSGECYHSQGHPQRPELPFAYCAALEIAGQPLPIDLTAAQSAQTEGQRCTDCAASRAVAAASAARPVSWPLAPHPALASDVQSTPHVFLGSVVM